MTFDEILALDDIELLRTDATDLAGALFTSALDGGEPPRMFVVAASATIGLMQHGALIDALMAELGEEVQERAARAAAGNYRAALRTLADHMRQRAKEPA